MPPPKAPPPLNTFQREQVRAAVQAENVRHRRVRHLLDAVLLVRGAAALEGQPHAVGFARHRGAELALLKRILGSAPAHVRLRAEPCATVAALRSLLTGGCDVVHYTGHGVRGALTFELEGRAELDVCTEETLGRLVAAGGHRTKVVFLAACDSERPAKALTRQGIPHVVCVRAGARLSDRTARAFSEQFYDALCRGKTVRSAFDVAAAVDEHGSYLLLPSGGGGEWPMEQLWSREMDLDGKLAKQIGRASCRERV